MPLRIHDDVISALVIKALENIHLELREQRLPPEICTSVAHTASQALGSALAKALRDKGVIVGK